MEDGGVYGYIGLHQCDRCSNEVAERQEVYGCERDVGRRDGEREDGKSWVCVFEGFDGALSFAA